jgi:hypothetical protein
MKIKLLENFNTESIPEFEQKIGTKPGSIFLMLEKEPGNLRNGYLREGIVKWSLDLKYEKRGIIISGVKLLEMEFEIQLEDDDDNSYNETVTATKEQLKNCPIEFELHELPISIKSIEINMRHSVDPEDWKFDVKLGEDDQ